MFTLKDFLNGDAQLIVLDVEAVGLHGEAFAYAYTKITMDNVTAQVVQSCPVEAAQGSEQGRDWVLKNVPPLVATVRTPLELRESFWKAWIRHSTVGQPCAIAADVPWPVESRFLQACVDDNPTERAWQGPYPLISIDTILWVCGIDPLQTYERRGAGPTHFDCEEPAHHPLMDTRHSARLLLEALNSRSSVEVLQAHHERRRRGNPTGGFLASAIALARADPERRLGSDSLLLSLVVPGTRGRPVCCGM